jgi:hypothetical protein
VLQLLVTANVVPNSMIPSTLMMEAIPLMAFFIVTAVKTADPI